MINSDLRETLLQGTILWEATLQGSNLSSARLQGANLSYARLQGTDLYSANLQGADLFLANLQGANLYHAKLQGANLGSAKLQGASLGFANLQGTNLRSAKLQGADLHSAKLQGANLNHSYLTLVDLQKVVVGIFTPEDYDQVVKENVKESSLSPKTQGKIFKLLQNKIGQNTQIDNETNGDNILASTDPNSHLKHTILNANNLNLVKSEQDYTNYLSMFLINLACSDKNIAQSVIKHRVGYRCNLIQKIILVKKNDSSRQCTDLANLDSELLKKLEWCSS